MTAPTVKIRVTATVRMTRLDHVEVVVDRDDFQAFMQDRYLGETVSFEDADGDDLQVYVTDRGLDVTTTEGDLHASEDDRDWEDVEIHPQD